MKFPETVDEEEWEEKAPQSSGACLPILESVEYQNRSKTPVASPVPSGRQGHWPIVRWSLGSNVDTRIWIQMCL